LPHITNTICGELNIIAITLSFNSQRSWSTAN